MREMGVDIGNALILDVGAGVSQYYHHDSRGNWITSHGVNESSLRRSTLCSTDQSVLMLGRSLWLCIFLGDITKEANNESQCAALSA